MTSWSVDANLRQTLKEQYYDAPIPDAVMRKYPLFALINKDSDFTGSQLVIPIKIAHAGGRGHGFSAALASQSSPTWKKWVIDVVPDYHSNTIPREAVLRTKKGPRSAFIKLFVDAIEDGIEAVDKNTAHELYGTSIGYKAQIHASSTVTTATITLANPQQAQFFEIGMRISVGDSAGALRALAGGAGTESVLTAIDRVNGTLTAALHWDDVYTSIAAGDYIYIAGDATVALSGLADWCPASAPGATAFFGVARNVDTRLGGWRRAYDGSVPEELIKKALNEAAALNNGEFSHVLMHPQNFQQLEISLMSSGLYQRPAPGTKEAEYGFVGAVITYAGGSVTVLSDPACPINKAWGVKIDELTLTYMGDRTGAAIIDDDGQFIRSASADAYDVRVGNFCQLYTPKPQNLVYIPLA